MTLLNIVTFFYSGNKRGSEKFRTIAIPLPKSKVKISFRCDLILGAYRHIHVVFCQQNRSGLSLSSGFIFFQIYIATHVTKQMTLSCVQQR